MGEEVNMTDYDGATATAAADDRILEWELGLPSLNDLTPLSQPLIPPELASAFSISPEPFRTLLDVNRASQTTLSSLRGGTSQAFSSNNFNDDPIVVEADEEEEADRSKLRKIDCTEEAGSALRTQNSTDDLSARALKRPRLVWTPQLHKRFVDVVAHLGIKNAVPKTIMQLMNVEGLTRENVASHLQKYRLYLKRMQGLSNDGPSSSDHLFVSTPVPQSLHDSAGGTGHSHAHGNGHLPVPISMMPYPPPLLGMPHHRHPHMVGNHAFDSHPYNMLQQRDWSASLVPYPPHVATKDN